MLIATDEQEARRVRFKDSSKPFHLAPMVLVRTAAEHAPFCSVGIAKEVRTAHTPRSLTSGAAASRVSMYSLFAELLGDEVSLQRRHAAHKVFFKFSDVGGPFWPAAGVRVLDSMVH